MKYAFVAAHRPQFPERVDCLVQRLRRGLAVAMAEVGYQGAISVSTWLSEAANDPLLEVRNALSKSMENK